MSNQTNLPSDHLLPEEIWNLILLKLPINSILICTAVCKSWNSLIKSASFISSHLNHSISNSNPLYLLHHVSNSVPEIERFSLHLDDDDLTEHAAPTFPYRFRNAVNLLSCCNGLVLVGEVGIGCYDLFLWNPNLRKLVMLPPREYKWYGFAGLGYDSSTIDYKALVVSQYDPFKLSLYSLNSNSWQWSRDLQLKSIYSMFGGNGCPSMTLFNRNFHLAAQISYDGDMFLLAFDMSDGECNEIMLPSRGFYMKMANCGVNIVCGGLMSVFLACTRDDYSVCYELWVMKEYGVEESWTQTAKFTWPEVVESVRHPLLLSFRGNGEAIVVVDGEIVLYNVGDNVIKKVGIMGSYCSFYLDSYIESLALLDRGDMV